MKQINDLLKNNWIEECGGSWGSMIVLAAKPHQEHVHDIRQFVWRMCVSYRGLNKVTKLYEYPIPRCDMAITIIELGSTGIFFITMDTKQGYHQIAVRACDIEKLAFFGPNSKKYGFRVMPFGPVNAPGFYTCMMGTFKTGWDLLFLDIMTSHAESNRLLGGHKVTFTDGILSMDGIKNASGSKSIIDDIMLWSNNVSAVLLYFECVCRVFQKYRVSFRLDKCRFLEPRVEFVGHDLTVNGNCPAQSKFDLIRDWEIPSSGQSLHTFVGLIMFYVRYTPYLEERIKPFRRLIKEYFRQHIPIMVWTPDLLRLFDDIKLAITTSPVLARYDPSKPTFLKTDWSAEGMGWIIMQPADDLDSFAATKLLQNGGPCLFDVSTKGARILPIAFASRCCTDMEKRYHSFVGEAACG